MKLWEFIAVRHETNLCPGAWGEDMSHTPLRQRSCDRWEGKKKAVTVSCHLDGTIRFFCGDECLVAVLVDGRWRYFTD